MENNIMMKLRIATGLGLLLFMATMIGGPVGMSQAGDRGVTLASLAGNFASRTSGTFTLCYNESFTEAVDCASALHQEVHFKVTSVGHGTRDAAWKWLRSYQRVEHPDGHRSSSLRCEIPWENECSENQRQHHHLV